MSSGGKLQQPRGPSSSSSSKDMCDYCHQQPKFPPYEYCSKACGSRAKAATRGPTMCKQCGTRQVHKGHQFCGKGCANTWQSLYGPLYTNWYGTNQMFWGQQQQRAWTPGPPRQLHHIPGHPGHPGHSGHLGHSGQGDNPGGAIVTGIFNAFKNLVSPSPLQKPPSPRRRSTLPSPQNGQQFPAPSPRDPAMHGPNTSLGTGPGGRASTRSPGPASPGPSQQRITPSSSTSSGSNDSYASVQTTDRNLPSSPPSPTLQIQQRDSTTDQDLTAMGMPGSPPTYSSLGNPQLDDDLDIDPLGDDQNQVPAGTSNRGPAVSDDDDGGSTSLQVLARTNAPTRPPPSLPGDGGHGKRKDPKTKKAHPIHRFVTTSSGLHAICRFQGCDKQVFVDPMSKLPSEYCSQRHREEAATSGQVDTCIMCAKMPKGYNDHFCSKACRDKAMRG